MGCGWKGLKSKGRDRDGNRWDRRRKDKKKVSKRDQPLEEDDQAERFFL